MIFFICRSDIVIYFIDYINTILEKNNIFVLKLINNQEEFNSIYNNKDIFIIFQDLYYNIKNSKNIYILNTEQLTR